MGMGDKDKFELENKSEDPMNYSPDMSSDWRFGGSNLTNTSVGLISVGNSMSVSKGDLVGSSCSSASMVDSFGPTIWEHPTNSQSLSFCDISVPNNSNTLSTLGMRKGTPASWRSGIDRALDMCWNPQNSMSKRAARFSCFNGGNFNDMVNPFAVPESMGLYSRGAGMMPGAQDILAGNGMKSASGVQSQKNELNAGEALKDASLTVEHGATDGSLLRNERKSESLVKSHDEAKQGVGNGGSGNESDEAEFSGGGQEEPSMLEGPGGAPSTKGLGSKKRKRNGQDTDLDQPKGASQHPGESAKDNTEQKGDQNHSTGTNKATGKHSKQGSQASDQPKEEYIHVRARRGQATNSHSLAERVRREKISERMKFLQDLVPGCSKVTGKAVMLDEIINYVQSLQRQVEFLSMKLATVNPRLDFNIEGLLAKDVNPSVTCWSFIYASIFPDMPMAYPSLHPSQQGLIQAGIPGMGSSSDVLRRTLSSQLTPLTVGFKEPTQLPNVWEDELNNVVQMSYGTSAPPPPNSHDADVSLPAGHMKVEL
ncbi:hypothetical protein FNV43_RR26994 [Rhamnella rubrinervis]|uniref:BHLH domain-containing protein n=1 Tax=Rhamnella rubrinervis TaxID=2594499 RepID=A0A8K0DQZ2_9ROSA|nr:hypothetical protein FNV43_RR26994 [Rhamnella rubrinervis]